MAFDFGPFPVVVGAVVQGCEGGEKQCAFEFLVPASAGVFASDRRFRSARIRGAMPV